MAGWHQLSYRDSDLSTDRGFLEAITVWCRKPHVVNRRLLGSVQCWVERVPSNSLNVDIVLSIRRHLLQDYDRKSLDDTMAFIRNAVVANCLSNSFVCDANLYVDVWLRLMIPKRCARYRKTMEMVIVGRYFSYTCSVSCVSHSYGRKVGWAYVTDVNAILGSVFACDRKKWQVWLCRQYYHIKGQLAPYFNLAPTKACRSWYFSLMKRWLLKICEKLCIHCFTFVKVIHKYKYKGYAFLWDTFIVLLLCLRWAQCLCFRQRTAVGCFHSNDRRS